LGRCKFHLMLLSSFERYRVSKQIITAHPE
jgi:hypothetical protein